MTCLFLLLVSHAVCDYALQSDSMARGKCEGQEPVHGVPWFYWLGAHCLIHAGGVYMVTQRIDLAIAELIAHFVIDNRKCCKAHGIHVDQALHVLCKIAWACFCIGDF